jgi:hypothetical protein
MYFIVCVYKWYMAVVQHHIDNFTSNDAFTIKFFDILYRRENGIPFKLACQIEKMTINQYIGLGLSILGYLDICVLYCDIV